MCETKSEKIVFALLGWLLAKGVSWGLAIGVGFIGFCIGLGINLARFLG